MKIVLVALTFCAAFTWTGLARANPWVCLATADGFSNNIYTKDFRSNEDPTAAWAVVATKIIAEKFQRPLLADSAHCWDEALQSEFTSGKMPAAAGGTSELVNWTGGGGGTRQASSSALASSASGNGKIRNQPSRYAKECLKIEQVGGSMHFRNACTFVVSVGYCSLLKGSDFPCKPDGKGGYSGGGLIQLEPQGTYPAPAPAAAMTCKGPNSEVGPRLTMLRPVKGQCMALN
jgi:hypothetical protein